MEFDIHAKISNLIRFIKIYLKFNPNEEKLGIALLKLRPFDVIEIHCNWVVEPLITNNLTDIKKH